jgi:hypothetical protein
MLFWLLLQALGRFTSCGVDTPSARPRAVVVAIVMVLPAPLASRKKAAPVCGQGGGKLKRRIGAEPEIS